MERLCLIDEGVGRDSISDFTVNLIKGFLLDYTQSFAKRYLNARYCAVIPVNKVAFNYASEIWEHGEYYLPCIAVGMKLDFVLLTPKNILAKDDGWINKPDLLKDFWIIKDHLSDLELRAQLNNYLRKVLPKDPSDVDKRNAAKRAIKDFPVLIEHFIRHKEDNGDRAVSISSEKVRESEDVYLSQFRSLVRLLSLETDFYPIPSTCSRDEALKRCSYFKWLIEYKEGYKLLWYKGRQIANEKDLHILFRFVWCDTDYDVNREPNTGRGNPDFKVSKGRRDQCMVEFKLASNSQLRQSLQKQLNLYKVADKTKDGFYVVIYFTREEEHKLRKMLTELGMIDGKDVVIVDARRDNKPTGSTA